MLTNKIKSSRGLRQGDPLSPYLFVLCMERLAHDINEMVHQGTWKPIILSWGGLPLFHLFFADDLILFEKTSISQVDIIHTMLSTFCTSSG